MRRLLATFAFVAAVCLSATAADQYARFNGSCQQGGSPSVTNGIQSSQAVQLSFPACTVTVFVHGTLTKPSLFSDAAGTIPIANPFAATSTGVIGFYAANGRYDVQLSGAGITAPFTISDITLCFNCTGGGGGTPITVNGGAALAGTVNFQNGNGGTVASNPSSSNIEIDLPAVVGAGSCTNCNVTFDAFGRSTTFSNGAGGGGGSPGGADTQVQFNDATAFNGVPTLTTNKTTGQTNASNLSKMRVVTAFYNYLYTDTAGSIGNLTSPGAGKTLTLPCTTASPCVGIDTSNNTNAPYYVDIKVTGTPEAALVTGGTCPTSIRTTSCTIIVTTLNAHANGYTVGSSTTGIQEAINECGGAHCGALLAPAAASSVPTYTIDAAVYMPFNKMYLGSIGGTASVLCNTRDACVRTGSNLGGMSESIVENIEFESGLIQDGVLISSVKANLGVFTITTTTPHPFVNNATFTDTILFSYSTLAQSQEAKVNTAFGSVHTGANCVNGTAGGGACTTTEFEYTIGSVTTFSSSSGFGWANIENAAIEDVGNRQSFRNLKLLGNGSGHFNWGIVIGNDQRFLVDGFSTEGSGSVIQCATSAFCGALAYTRSDQGAAPQGRFTNMQASMQCHGNGFRLAGANGIAIDNSTVQGLNQYAVFSGSGLNASNFDVVYQESSSCANFNYPQGGGLQQAQAGYILNAASNISSKSAISGAFPSFVAQNVGTQTNYYYDVIKANGQSMGMFYAGKCLTTGVGNCTVYWPEPDLGGLTGPITYDILVIPVAAGNHMSSAPYTGNANSVATGLTRGTNCTANTGICSFVDPQSGTTPYSMPALAIAPKFVFEPAAIVLGKSIELTMTECGGGGSFISSTLNPTVFCAGHYVGVATSDGYTPVYTSSFGTDANSSQLRLLSTGSGPNASNIKGNEINIALNTTTNPSDFKTFLDCNPSKTLANAGYHNASADTCDMAIGNDAAAGTALANNQMSIRAAKSISRYIGIIPDNLNWIDRCTATTCTFQNNLVTLTGAINLGSTVFGFSPFQPTGTQVSGYGNGSNFTTIAGTVTYSPSGQLNWASNSGAPFSAASVAYTATTFNANQFSRAKVVTAGADFVGVMVHMSNTPGTFSGYLYFGNGAGSFLEKCAAGGACSILATGLPAILVGDTLYESVTVTASTATVTALQNGVQVASVTDSSSPLLTGWAGSYMSNAASLNTFVAGDLSQSAKGPISVQDIVINGTCTGCATGTITASGSLTATAIVTGSAATVIQTPSATTTVDGSGNISTPGSYTSTGANGGLFGVGGTGNCSPGVGNYCFYPDAALLGWHMNDNNVDQGIAIGTRSFQAVYNHSGTQATTPHVVQDRCTLGTDCTVTLTGSAVYTASSTYDCTAIDRTSAAAVKFAPSSGSAFTLTGTGTDLISYLCIGN